MHQGESTTKLQDTTEKRKNEIHSQDEFAMRKVNTMKDDNNYKGIALYLSFIEWLPMCQRLFCFTHILSHLLLDQSDIVFKIRETRETW